MPVSRSTQTRAPMGVTNQILHFWRFVTNPTHGLRVGQIRPEGGHPTARARLGANHFRSV
jgi:hypothetical protein